jgi:hypothetical protein
MAKTSIEIRINSVADAKSVVRNQKEILQRVKENSKDSIEFLVAAEIQTDVNAIIRGVFRIPTYTSYVSCRPGNALYRLPHYSEKPIEIPIRQTTMKVEQVPVSVSTAPTVTNDAPKKRGGRPFGSKNKPKPTLTQ